MFEIFLGNSLSDKLIFDIFFNDYETMKNFGTYQTPMKEHFGKNR